MAQDVHMEIWEMEQADNTREWQRWCKLAEKALRLRSLDGEEREDGYSLDYAMDAFDEDMSPDEYAAKVRATVAWQRNHRKVAA